jgi:hypothetical protein
MLGVFLTGPCGGGLPCSVVGVADGVVVGVPLAVGVAVTLGVKVALGVTLGVRVGRGVFVGLGVSVAVGVLRLYHSTQGFRESLAS